LDEPALCSAPFARSAVSHRRPLQEEPIADQSLVVVAMRGRLSVVTEQAHRHAEKAAVRRNTRRWSVAVGDVSSHPVVSTRPWQSYATRNLAVINDGEVPVGVAHLEREAGEAGGDVEVRDAARLVAGEGGRLDGHHERAVVVGYALDAVRALRERPVEVGAAAIVAREAERRETAVRRLHAAERERVRDAQVPASRRSAACGGVVDGGSCYVEEQGS